VHFFDDGLEMLPRGAIEGRFSGLSELGDVLRGERLGFHDE